MDVVGPGGFRTSAFDARWVVGDVRVIDRWMGGWAYEGKAAMVEVPVGVGDEPSEVLDVIGAIIRDLDEDGCEGVVDANKIVIGGLSCDGEESRCGGSKG